MINFIIRYLLSILSVGFVLYISSMYIGLHISMFVDFNILILVLIPTLCLSFIGSSNNKETLFKNMKDNSIRFGWIGFIINLVTMSFSLGGLNQVTSQSIAGIIGLQFGIGSISLLYGYLFGYLIFEPLRKYYSKKN